MASAQEARETQQRGASRDWRGTQAVRRTPSTLRRNAPMRFQLAKVWLTILRSPFRASYGWQAMHLDSWHGVPHSELSDRRRMVSTVARQREGGPSQSLALRASYGWQAMHLDSWHSVPHSELSDTGEGWCPPAVREVSKVRLGLRVRRAPLQVRFVGIVRGGFVVAPAVIATGRASGG